MKTLHTKQIAVLLKMLFQFERRGEYERGLAEIENIGEEFDNSLPIEGFSKPEAAELFLRFGSLIGFDGHLKQIPNAQERSKNLLTESRRQFIKLNNTKKVAECENYIALAYWRTGEIVEAETWVNQSLLHNISAFDDVRLYSKIIKCLILLAGKKFNKIITTLADEENNFLRSDDAGLKADYYNHYGLALKNLGHTSEALKLIEKAWIYHQKSGHKIYLAAIGNNLAQLYKTRKKFAEAHETIDHSTKIFKKLKDRTREGYSLDTKSQIYFAEEKYQEALITIETAISIMKEGENLAYLVDSLMTKTKILIYLDDIAAATSCLFEAVQTAKTHISEEAANNLVKEFDATLKEKSAIPETEKTDNTKAENTKFFELILPPSMAHYRNVQGVRIKNTHLEAFGLVKDSLAIVVKDKIQRGDLAAVTEIATDEVICGFYDKDFGIVCLENGIGEPTIFDENEITILGKIIGVCESEKNSDGKTVVKPLNFSR